MTVIVILLTLFLYVGCSSPDASRSTMPKSSFASSKSNSNRLMDNEAISNQSSIVVDNGSSLYAGRIFLVSLQNGGHELYAEEWTTTNKLAWGTGSKVHFAFGADWEVRVCQGTLSVTNASALHDFHIKDSVMGRYKVRTNDTKTNIALRFYGDATAWPLIYDANQALLKNDGLHEGIVLDIPFRKQPGEEVVEIFSSEGSDLPVRVEIIKKGE